MRISHYQVSSIYPIISSISTGKCSPSAETETHMWRDKEKSQAPLCPQQAGSLDSVILFVVGPFPQEGGASPWAPSNASENCTSARRLEGTDPRTFSERGPPLEPRSQTVTVDFCQEMTDKCTTDEQPRKDYTQ